MNLLRETVFTAEILFILFSAANACLSTPGSSPTFLNAAISFAEGLASSSAPSDAVQEKSESPPTIPSPAVVNFSFPANCSSPSCLRIFLKYYDYTKRLSSQKTKILFWNYHTNLTIENLKKASTQQRLEARWAAKTQKYAQRLTATFKLTKPFGLTEGEARQFSRIGARTLMLKKAEARGLARSKGRMSQIYGRASIVLKNKKRLKGDAAMTNFFRENKDYDDLLEVWKLWRQAAGKPMRKSFEKFVTLLKAVAKRNNFTDVGRYQWLNDFKDPKFNIKIMNMYGEVLPLYRELHAYVRFKLSAKYPKRFDPKGPIPAHILGNPWAQGWENTFDYVQPYPEAVSSDVTGEMKRQNWTVMRMVKTAEEFFTSLGLPKMTEKFWKKSVFVNTKIPRMTCHPSATDFFSGDDFRIKMCAEVNQFNLQVIHHEMGHVIYYMLYAHQPIIFRGGANSGFHEAVGDTIALSVNTVQHLAKIGLVKVNAQTKEVTINTLMRMALKKLALLSFSLTLDSWRWRVHNGTIKTTELNEGWWRLRRDLQGLRSPVPGSEEDFDAGAKYHVANNVPYIRYYVSIFLQFQFYEAMCKASGHTGALHTCDFYQSKTAGDLLRSTLSLGMSKPWPQVMQVMTGQTEISTTSLKSYFAPLFDWLKDYRQTHKYPIGW